MDIYYLLTLTPIYDRMINELLVIDWINLINIAHNTKKRMFIIRIFEHIYDNSIFNVRDRGSSNQLKYNRFFATISLSPAINDFNFTSDTPDNETFDKDMKLNQQFATPLVLTPPERPLMRSIEINRVSFDLEIPEFIELKYVIELEHLAGNFVVKNVKRFLGITETSWTINCDTCHSKIYWRDESYDYSRYNKKIPANSSYDEDRTKSKFHTHERCALPLCIHCGGSLFYGVHDLPDGNFSCDDCYQDDNN